MNNRYNRPYMQNYTNNQQNFYEQNLYDQIDNQINNLVGMRNQLRNNQQQQSQQPTSINQTFQLSPNGGGIKYANSIDDVTKETVFFDTPFFSKDLSVLWIKSSSGDIRAYELTEIVQKDEKDLEIEFLQSQQKEKDNQIGLLQAQIDDLRKEMRINEQYATNVIQSENETDATTTDGATRKATKSTKSTSISRVSTSSKK